MQKYADQVRQPKEKQGKEKSRNPAEFRLSVWHRLDLNQGHKDFQSSALPTELRRHSPFICVCKFTTLLQHNQIFCQVFSLFDTQRLIFNLLYFVSIVLFCTIRGLF